MPVKDPAIEHDTGELRLFLEEVMAGLCRYRHVVGDGTDPASVSIVREVRLPNGNGFADVRVTAPPRRPYFVEVKYGHAPDEIVRRLGHKFGHGGHDQAAALLVVVDDLDDAETERLRGQLADAVSDLEIEVWNEARLGSEIRSQLGVELASLKTADLQAIRDAILSAEWRSVFDGAPVDLTQTLLWHFGPWTLKRLRGAGFEPSSILKPGNYRGVSILMADLCGFSSYMRDSRDDEVVRRVLTAFYSHARHAVHEADGMLYQFVGDEVVALFGFPNPDPDASHKAIDCARRLLDIGYSISDHWQRRLDHVQASRGVHIGVARGDLNLVPLRAFSRYYIGFIGSALNMTARLMTSAGPGEVVVSNGLYQALDGRGPRFDEIAPLEAKNIGTIKAWKLAAG